MIERAPYLTRKNHTLEQQRAHCGLVRTCTFPSPEQEQVIHILSHGGVDHVCDMKASTFNDWMVKAFKMSSNKGLNQTYFIYSCDVAKGGSNLLSGLAVHVAKSQFKNRRFIGTVGENGVVKTTSGKGKVLVQTEVGKLQDLGLGWKGYRTLFKSVLA